MRIYSEEEAKKVQVEEIPQEHESDLSPKEKRLREMARFKEMSISEKLGFLWDYYKWVIPVVIFAIFFIYEGMGIYHRLQQKILLSFAVVDVPIDAQDDIHFFCDDLAAFMGSTDDLHIVEMDASAISGDAPEAVSKLTVLMAAGMTDIAVLDPDNYEKYAESDAFMDWREILGEEFEYYSQMFEEDGRLDLSKNPKWLSYRLTYYEPAYAAVIVSSERVEATKEFIRFLAQEE
ncbi:MAG: hypothetical protein IIZ39_09160 [Blautia sp.]|nr:hypothetical protein [Blautia sp.]